MFGEAPCHLLISSEKSDNHRIFIMGSLIALNMTNYTWKAYNIRVFIPKYREHCRAYWKYAGATFVLQNCRKFVNSKGDLQCAEGLYHGSFPFTESALVPPVLQECSPQAQKGFSASECVCEFKVVILLCFEVFFILCFSF